MKYAHLRCRLVELYNLLHIIEKPKWRIFSVKMYFFHGRVTELLNFFNFPLSLHLIYFAEKNTEKIKKIKITTFSIETFRNFWFPLSLYLTTQELRNVNIFNSV